MSKENILVVGAGGLGLACAYHLQLAGAEISFLVRPHRQEALSRPQRLYCYNDHTVKVLDNYRVFTAVDALEGQSFDFILVTLDGATCRGEAGVATLEALGRIYAGSGAHLLFCGVGLGLREHIASTTGFDNEHLLEGTMGSFAYQVDRADMPLPPPTDVELHNSADIAFLNFAKRPGFIVSSRPARGTKAFVALFNRCGVTHCQRVPHRLYAMFTNMFFPFIAASEINGWQGTDALIADQELWHLCCESQREIMGLRRHGLPGKLFPLLMSDKRLEKSIRETDAAAAPMGFTAFNRFHHGGKVREQNQQILANCIATGEREGKAMAATRELVARRPA